MIDHDTGNSSSNRDTRVAAAAARARRITDTIEASVMNKVNISS